MHVLVLSKNQVSPALQPVRHVGLQHDCVPLQEYLVLPRVTDPLGDEHLQGVCAQEGL